MIVAQLDTQHFTFTALGETEEEALAALARGWEAHGRQIAAEKNGATVCPAAEALEAYAAVAFEVPVGGCARDYKELR